VSAILKSGSASLEGRVRPLLAALPEEVPAADPERERLEAEVARLGAALAARDEAVARLQEEAAQAFAAGEAEGREAGLREADDRGAELLAAVEQGVEAASARFAKEMGALEALALLVARTCLERMLLASEERTQLVAELIRGQVAALGDGAVLRIQVSAQDFASAEALAQIPGGGPNCEILSSEGLASGDCRIGLRLGGLDIGLGQQWGALRAELEAMLDAGGAA
jgi:flagellar biosynthesis/type III secretory pathway protein FliH